MSAVTPVRRRWLLVVTAVILIVVLFGARVAGFVTDVWWFQSVGYEDVLWKVLGTRVLLGVVAGVAVLALLGANLLLARRLAPPYRIPSPEEEGIERWRELLEPFARPLLLAVAAVVGLFSGFAISPRWQTFLLWSNAVDFGVNDPQFARDLGWFVFRLPFWQLLNSWLFSTLVVTVILTAVAHYLFGGIRPQSSGRRLSPQASAHLSVLLAAVVAVRTWGYLLDRALLSYSERGQVTGLSYTDVHAELPALQFLAVIGAVVVVLFLLNVRVRGWILPSAGVAIMFVAAAVLQGVYPAAIQRLQVDPQELLREEPYIARNLEFTRYGFGIRLDEDVSFANFPATSQLAPDVVADNERTLSNIRLWDPTTLQRTYEQLQQFRTYYDFRDVDVDRYTLDGQPEQTMVAVRELSEQDLPERARTWQNRRLVYTHGFGMVASDVSRATGEGQPEFFLRDIPPRGSQELQVENPRVYFGENPPEYSIVGTDVAELDYPVEEGAPRTFAYRGDDGVAVDSLPRRLMFALRYGEPNFVLSNLIGEDSRVLFRRNIRERVRAVAPFLQLDHDAYPVAADGRIKWVLDGYTITDMLPYSERVNLDGLTLNEQRRLVPRVNADGVVELVERLVPVPGLEGRANYIRNSVKAVVDAYDGSVTLYVVDDTDPLIKAWQRAFPGKFTPADRASADLRAHFRYPEDMFRVQAALFETYHIPEAAEFYTKEDAWDIPLDPTAEENELPPRDLRPYYLLMRLPGEKSEEFALIQPFTPASRENLTGWLAGRSDPDVYGQLKAYAMPPDRTVYGPGQIQARINQDDTVAAQVTLWDQSGSRVIYGNLLVIPLGDSLLYAQPLFLRAQRSEIPELSAVVLVLGDDVVMGDTLADALRQLFGESTPQEPGEPEPGRPATGQTVDPRVRELIDQALRHFDAAERALRAGDLATYQRETEAAEASLRQARGGPSEGAAPPPPSSSPSPETQAEA